jgi:uncharacterized protein YecE (DUF72 family)
VELNPTFYAIPDPGTVENWAASVPDGFRFAPKVYRAISHDRRLRGIEGLLERFVESIRRFGNRLGTCFLQLPPSLGMEVVEDLNRFLDLWPKDLRIAVEFRRRDWFRHDEGFEVLQRHGAAAVITDSPGRRDAVHMRLTSGEVFVRFLGNDLHPTDFQRVDDWIRRLEGWVSCGLEALWFTFHQPREINSPRLAAFMIERLNDRLQTGLTPPRPLQPRLLGVEEGS